MSNLTFEDRKKLEDIKQSNWVSKFLLILVMLTIFLCCSYKHLIIEHHHYFKGYCYITPCSDGSYSIKLTD